MPKLCCILNHEGDLWMKCLCRINLGCLGVKGRTFNTLFATQCLSCTLLTHALLSHFCAGSSGMLLKCGLQWSKRSKKNNSYHNIADYSWLLLLKYYTLFFFFDIFLSLWAIWLPSALKQGYFKSGQGFHQTSRKSWIVPDDAESVAHSGGATAVAHRRRSSGCAQEFRCHGCDRSMLTLSRRVSHLSGDWNKWLKLLHQLDPMVPSTAWGFECHYVADIYISEVSVEHILKLSVYSAQPPLAGALINWWVIVSCGPNSAAGISPRGGWPDNFRWGLRGETEGEGSARRWTSIGLQPALWSGSSRMADVSRRRIPNAPRPLRGIKQLCCNSS